MRQTRFIVLSALVSAGMALACQVGAQTLETPAIAVDRLQALHRSEDQALIRNATTTVRQVETSVQDVLVTYQPRHDSEMRRVGVPLLASSATGLGLAYDLAGKNLMAQWNFSPSNLGNTSVRYRAFLSESGQVSFTVSSRF